MFIVTFVFTSDKSREDVSWKISHLCNIRCKPGNLFSLKLPLRPEISPALTLLSKSSAAGVWGQRGGAGAPLPPGGRTHLGKAAIGNAILGQSSLPPKSPACERLIVSWDPLPSTLEPPEQPGHPHRGPFSHPYF